MDTGKLHVVLGCFGWRDDDFVSCAGSENRILNIEDNLTHYNQLMDYMDSCRLFDKPIFDYNAVRHFLFNVRDRFDQPTKRIWSEKKFGLLEKFTIEHRKCGLYLKLLLINPELESPEPADDKKIFIPGSENQSQPKISKLRVVRGR